MYRYKRKLTLWDFVMILLGSMMMMMIDEIECQHYESFVSGIIVLPQQMPYTYSIQSKQQQQYRNFTIQSSQSMITNSSLIFSPLSFNYFQNQLSCFQKEKRSTTITISCSVNVYKLAYLLIQKGPNMFVVYRERSYQIGKSNVVKDTVDVSEWVEGVGIGLEELIIIGQDSDNVQQYEIKMHNFISVIGLFNNNSSNNSNSSLILTNIKLTPSYSNISFNQQQESQQKLLALPLTVSITKSLNINRIGFFSLVIITQMISLNYQFSNVQLGNKSQQSGQLRIGYFMAISQMVFIVGNNTNNTSSGSIISNSSENNINFNIQQNFTSTTSSTYNITQQQQNYNNISINKVYTFILNKFNRDKIYNYTKGSNLKVKLNVLHDYYYVRCGDSNDYNLSVNNNNGSRQQLLRPVRHKRMDTPIEGRYYKLVPLMNTSLAMEIDQKNGNNIKLSLYNNQTSTQHFYIHSLDSNRYRLLSSKTNTPLMYNKSTQSYLLSNGWYNDSQQTKWRVVYNVDNVTNQPYVMINLNGISMYVTTESGAVRQGEGLMMKRVNASVSNDIFRWMFIQVGNQISNNNKNNMSNWINNNNNNRQVMSIQQYPSYPSKQIYVTRYFAQFGTFITQSYNNNKVYQYYSYFSIHQLRCYSQLEVDYMLVNQKNSNNSVSKGEQYGLLTSYFINTNNIASMNSSSQSLNTTTININNIINTTTSIVTSSIWFASSHIYGVVVNKLRLQQYLNDRTNIKGYIIYDVFVYSNNNNTNDNDNSLYQLFVRYNYNIHAISNNHTSEMSRTQLVKMSDGCQVMRPVIKSNKQYGYECEQCKSHYVMYNNVSVGNQPSNVTLYNKCYCPLNYYMTIDGQCQSCSTHEFKCQPPININAQIVTNNQQQQSMMNETQYNQNKQMIEITVYMYRQQQVRYQLITPINQLLSQMVVIVNGESHHIIRSKYKQHHIIRSKQQSQQQSEQQQLQNSIIDCTNVQYQFCIKFIIKNITQAEYYSINVVVDDDSLMLVRQVMQLYDYSYGDDDNVIQSQQQNRLLVVVNKFVQNVIVNPTRKLLSQVFNYSTNNNQTITPSFVSSVSSSKSKYKIQPVSQSSLPYNSTSLYFIRFLSPTTIIKQPLTIKSFIINSLQPSISSINTTKSIILMAAPFLLDKFNLLSILQTNSMLYMISFMKFNHLNNKKRHQQSSLSSIVRRMFIFGQQPVIKVFSIANDNIKDDKDKGWIQIPSYNTLFEQQFLYNSSSYQQLSYPQSLYHHTYKLMNPNINNNISSNSNNNYIISLIQQQNYMTMTLNSMVIVFVQILLMEIVIRLGIRLLSLVKQEIKTNKDNMNNKDDGKKVIVIKKQMIFDIKRHQLVGGVVVLNDGNKDKNLISENNQDNSDNILSNQNNKSHKQNLTLKNISFNNNSNQIQQRQQQQQLLELLTQKRIQWTPMSQLKQCQQIVIVSKGQEQQQQQLKVQQQMIMKKQVQKRMMKQQQKQYQKQFEYRMQQQQLQQQYQQEIQYQQKQQNNKKINHCKHKQATLKQQILFFLYTLQQKRLIFYTSFIIIHVISQSYLLYFQLIKPIGYNDNNNQDIGLQIVLLRYMDLLLSMIMMFFIIVFPVVLINYYPLHLLKIVQVTCKFGQYKVVDNHNHNQNSQKNNNKDSNSNKHFLQHSYTYGQIYFHFCIIYYQLIFIPFTVALGRTMLQQSLPILLYQLFKLIWLYKKLKVLDKLKNIAMCIVFGLIAVWHFVITYNNGSSEMVQYIFQDAIVYSLYCVLFLQFGKLVKFVVVFVVGLVKTKRKQIKNINKSINKNKSQKSQKSSKSLRSIKSLKSSKLQKKLKSNQNFIATTNKQFLKQSNKQIQIMCLQQQNNSPIQSQYNTQKIILDKKKTTHKNNNKSRTVKFMSNRTQIDEVKDNKNKDINDRQEKQLQVKMKMKENKNNTVLLIEDDNNYGDQVNNKYEKQQQINQSQNQPNQFLSSKYKFTRKRQKTIK